MRTHDRWRGVPGPAAADPGLVAVEFFDNRPAKLHSTGRRGRWYVIFQDGNLPRSLETTDYQLGTRLVNSEAAAALGMTWPVIPDGASVQISTGKEPCND